MASEFLVPDLFPTGFGPDGTVPVRPWVDEVIDAVGVDPRSAYVERFWLGILGPSTTLLLRRVASGFDACPDGFDLDLPTTARSLGLGHKSGPHSPFVRALWRSVQFELARVVGPCLEVRRRLPPLTRRQVQRLPVALQEAHASWQSSRIGQAAAAADQRRARTLALTMLEVDSDAAAVEQRLASWGVHPATAGDATRWAWERHAALSAS
jgi:hypothetical protein